jgi:hypothetical protein
MRYFFDYAGISLRMMHSHLTSHSLLEGIEIPLIAALLKQRYSLSTAGLRKFFHLDTTFYIGNYNVG